MSAEPAELLQEEHLEAVEELGDALVYMLMMFSGFVDNLGDTLK